MNPMNPSHLWNWSLIGALTLLVLGLAVAEVM
ncbi:hypothetical protein Mnod_2379 [Methylobacterium nodulans ORS 2060]|uniref:Uncharacterized protein n=1 Tax=Methylobacterium nodulans (strain LMG 21967 / CNCM I-2342 / ORS 2060) TaxID=460265 RepID=B8IBD9_METNO|nr:hypothetical protein Mnod_2379 [Methylobacterium nodulans ORS 2060]